MKFTFYVLVLSGGAQRFNWKKSRHGVMSNISNVQMNHFCIHNRREERQPSLLAHNILPIQFRDDRTCMEARWHNPSDVFLCKGVRLGNWNLFCVFPPSQIYLPGIHHLLFSNKFHVFLSFLVSPAFIQNEEKCELKKECLILSPPALQLTKEWNENGGFLKK